MGFKDAGQPHYLGHRERLRRRFREAGADALPDYELLELVLFRAVPRATFIMAKGNADRVQSYVSRGRRFRDLDDTRLCEKYVEGMREWASDPTDPARRLLSNDVNTTYGVQNLQPGWRPPNWTRFALRQRAPLRRCPKIGRKR